MQLRATACEAVALFPLDLPEMQYVKQERRIIIKLHAK